MLARGVTVLFLLAAALSPARAVELAAHRALYDLTLSTARGDVTAAYGTMSYEVTDACDGWAVHQQLAMTVTNRDGQDIDMLSDYTTYEAKDGTLLRFRSRQAGDPSPGTDIAGTAERKLGQAGTIRYTSPAGVTKPLPKGTLFPMAHTIAIIQGAEAGKHFFPLPLFDGTGADGAQDSTVAVVKWGETRKTPYHFLDDVPGGRVHIAFFPRGADVQEPDYEVSMFYWENGIADDLLMDFGDFVMRGRLRQLIPLKKGC